MLKNIFFFIGLICSSFCYSQNTVKIATDTIWTNPKFALRYGIGTQKYLFQEIGISRHSYCFAASKAYYTSFEWTQSNLAGFKVGYEINSMMIALALETKYLFNNTTSDIFLTPKVGLGLLGVANIYYGYNISANNNHLINNHQFSLVFNFNKNNISIFIK